MPLSRRDFIRTTTALTVSAGIPASARAANAKRPNLLWIMTDQQPASTIGAYGNPTIKTPNLDRIAKEGLRFDRFYIAAFPCSPSRACFLTGRYSHNHRVIQNDVILEDDVPVLGDILKAQGYNTGYVGKWHLTGHMYRDAPGRKPGSGDWYWTRLPDDRIYRYEHAQGGTGEDQAQHGFDFWKGGWKHYRDYLKEVGLGEFVDTTPVGNHNDLPSGPEGTHIHSQLPEEHHMASFFAQQASHFIEQQKDAGDPFGLVVSFYGPHLPVAPPKPWDEMYSLDQVPLPANNKDDLEGKPVRQLTNDRCYRLPEWTDDQFKDYIRRYWGYCSYIDHQIGRILEALEKSGKADDTIVLFTTDHGDMVSAHGFVFKLCFCGYEELLHIPFLLRYPGQVKAGKTTKALTSAVDVLPTLLDMMDVPKPDGIDGQSFVSLLGKPKSDHRTEVFCSSMTLNFTVVADNWKYVLNWNPRDIDELYDLSKDPGEMNNLAYGEDHAATVQDMRQRLTAWLTETGYPYKDSVVKAMNQEPQRAFLEIYPQITEFKDLGNGAFEFSYTWHTKDIPGNDKKYWSYTHFTNPKFATDGDIVFRDTTWPDPPTTQWEPGKTYAIGPVHIDIPPNAGPGKYAVRIGLYNPGDRSSPGQILGGQGNAMPVGELKIEKKDGKVTKLNFTPANMTKWIKGK